MKNLSLTLSLLVLTGCAFKPFPDVPLRVLDTTNGVCAKYKIVDHERLTVQHEADEPMDKCNGMVGFEHGHYNNNVKPWIREAIANLKAGNGKRLK